MKNLDLYLTSDRRVSMSLETYVEIRMSLIPHGETDLPEYPEPLVETALGIKVPKSKAGVTGTLKAED